MSEGCHRNPDDVMSSVKRVSILLPSGLTSGEGIMKTTWVLVQLLILVKLHHLPLVKRGVKIYDFPTIFIFIKAVFFLL